MIERIHVFDCDGVLMDSSHRYRTMPCNTRIDLDYWIENCTPEKIWQDEPLPMARLYRELLLSKSDYVIIATARVCQQADFDSIEFKLGKPQKFICREKGDHQGGVPLKLAGIRPLLNLKQFANAAITVYEDNLAYLSGLCEALNAKPIYIPSQQGH